MVRFEEDDFSKVQDDDDSDDRREDDGRRRKPQVFDQQPSQSWTHERAAEVGRRPHPCFSNLVPQNLI